MRPCGNYFKKYAKMIRDRCDIIINMTTGGARPTTGDKLDEMVKERCGLGAEMMSLNMGTINLWTPPYENVFMNEIPRIKKWVGYMYEAGIKPELEFYDTGMINATKMLVRDGIMKEPLHVQFVMVGTTGWSPTPRGGWSRATGRSRGRCIARYMLWMIRRCIRP